MKDIEYCMRRYKNARNTSDLWIALLETAYHYTVPNRNLFYWTTQFQGAQKNAKVYDCTGIIGVNKFVSKMQNAFTPPQMTWAPLTAGADIPEEDKERVERSLQDITDVLFSYIRRSNFDDAVNEVYYDAAISVGALICSEGPLDDDENLFHFYSVPASRLAIEQSYSGKIESNYRWFDEFLIRDIEQFWPEAKLTPYMQDMMKNDPNAVVKNLVEGIIYHHGERLPYQYVLMVDNVFLISKDVESSPWITFRINKVNTEIFGRGPVLSALPAILTLNELMRLELVSANMNVSKPIMAYSDGVFNPNTFVMQPNSIITVSPTSNGQFPLQPFPDTANPNFMQVTANDLRMQINALLYADPLGPVEAPTKTATEIGIRQRNLAEEIGPQFTRIQAEFLGPLIKRLIYILKKRGKIPPIEVDGREIEIRYKSPLTVSQGEKDVETFIRWFQVMQGTLGPEQAILYLNPLEMPLWSAQKMGVDMKVLNSKEQMADLLAQQSEQMQEQEQAMGMQGLMGMEPGMMSAAGGM